MKFVLLFLFLVLIGCDSDPVVSQANPRDLKYMAGDLVLIHEPFWNNCFGFVVDYDQRKVEDQPQRYKITIFCRSTGGIGKTIEVPEDKLQLRIRAELNTEEPITPQPTPYEE